MLNNDEHNVERSEWNIRENTLLRPEIIYIAIFTFSGIMN